MMNFVLDTGTMRSQISRTLTVEAGLGEGRAGPITIVALGASRTVQGAIHGDAVLYVGGARMILKTLSAVPPSMRPYGPEDGMLGADALAIGHIVIDFSSGVFSISPGRRAQ
jgi:hypothetical protein